MHDPANAVRAVAVTIPPGRVMTYGEIAYATGLHPRQVGRLVGTISETIPWWRVVRADGTPATCHDGTAPALLAQEQVPFTGHRVDLRALRERCGSSTADLGSPDSGSSGSGSPG